MGASAAGIPSSPDERPSLGLRASDAEREEVAARLRDEYVAGRLSHETFVYRMDAVLGARRRAELPPLLADLPAARRPGLRPLADWVRGTFTRLIRPHGAAADSAIGSPGPSPSLAPFRQPHPFHQPHQSFWSGEAHEPRQPHQPHQVGQPLQSAQPHQPPQSAQPHQPHQAGQHHQADLAGLAAQGGVIRATMGLPFVSGLPAPVSLRFPRGGDGEFSIGRDAGCDLAIADMTVSRRHATLERSADGWLISDLASTNGTRVNGWRVRGKVMVRPGDLVSFGNLEAVFTRDDRDDRDDREGQRDSGGRRERPRETEAGRDGAQDDDTRDDTVPPVPSAAPEGA